MLKDGLYEQIINKKIDEEIKKLTDKFHYTVPIDKAESSKILAQYISDVIKNCLDSLYDNDGDVSNKILLVNKIINTIINETKEADFNALKISERAEQLLALIDKKNNIVSCSLN